MEGYAHLAQFLSRPSQFVGAADELANAMGSIFQDIRDDAAFMVDFLRFLGEFMHCFGFSDRIYTLNGKVAPDAFAKVVSEKALFRDVYGRKHGEFSHTVQWFVMAYRFEGRLPVAELYANSVKYRSDPSTGFIVGYNKDKTAKHSPVEIWNFLVDCFEGDEDFRTNIMCETFRCPQIVTTKLNAILPSKNWLGEFIYQRRRRGLGLKKAERPSGYTNLRDIVWRKEYLKQMLRDYYDHKDENVYALKANARPRNYLQML
jgi:hypothetical protein